MRDFVIATSVACLVSAIPLTALAGEAQVKPGAYANIGYADTRMQDFDLGAVYGRVGYRFNGWFGVEGEVAAGVNSDRVVLFPAIPFDVTSEAKIRSEEAVYAVGFWPLAPSWDLIGRVGYGHSKVGFENNGDLLVRRFSVDGDSWNYGVGAQYHWDSANGVRADYTRHDFRGDDLNHADVWSIGYSRRF